MQEFAQYHLNKSSKYEAGTTDELLKGETWCNNTRFSAGHDMMRQCWSAFALCLSAGWFVSIQWNVILLSELTSCLSY